MSTVVVIDNFVHFGLYVKSFNDMHPEMWDVEYVRVMYLKYIIAISHHLESHFDSLQFLDGRVLGPVHNLA